MIITASLRVEIGSVVFDVGNKNFEKKGKERYKAKNL